jgi:transcriptional regulator GlxA family with amidase domain
MVREVPAILGGVIRDVVAVVGDRAAAFELGIACQVFGLDRSDDGLPCYDLAVCSARPGPVPTTSGFTIEVGHGPDRMRGADLVIVPAWPALDGPVPPALLDALRSAAAGGTRMLSICSGAFLLAAAGLLDGRRAATHWQFADRLARLHPRVMSPRAFARRFKAATGTTPHRWLLDQRLRLAEQLLESTDLPVDAVAVRAGFGSADTLRHHFTARRGVGPTTHRPHTFRGVPPAPHRAPPPADQLEPRPLGGYLRGAAIDGHSVGILDSERSATGQDNPTVTCQPARSRMCA